ncbi:golgin-45-like [Antedon mediterranea]|uniref:golgin-45-like n=1 Tax=Antedon mediterranea TaxID=105859 RepID=UPI003AF995FA
MSFTPQLISPRTITDVQTIVMDRGLKPNIATMRSEADGMENTHSETSTIRGTPTRHQFMNTQLRNSTEEAYKERLLQKAFEASPSHRSFQKGKNSPFIRTHDSAVVDMSFVDASDHKVDELENQVEELEQLLQKERTAAEKEKERFEAELAAQCQVNKELKKLLVASVGSDIQHQLETQTRDKTQLAQDLESTIGCLAKERENFERVNIQCDVWRSKFLGSRVQVDELVSLRNSLNMLLQESTYTLQKLMDERSEMRKHMMRSNRLLQYLSLALQRSQTLSQSNIVPSSNVITLALHNEQLSNAISTHLLGNIAIDSGTSKKDNIFVEWTHAEMLAKDILLNKTNSVKKSTMQVISSPESPTPMHKTSSNNHTGSTTPMQKMIDRYHPLTKYDNLTLNCCVNCTGEIKVL